MMLPFEFHQKTRVFFGSGVIKKLENLNARSSIQLGAFYAGVAIEQSMLGAAHACANPLTAQYKITHGVALAILLPHVVRWNAKRKEGLYNDFVESTLTKKDGASDNQLADCLIRLRRIGGFPSRLRDLGILKTDLTTLAESAGKQWTASFNPIQFGSSEALELHQCAF